MISNLKTRIIYYRDDFDFKFLKRKTLIDINAKPKIALVKQEIYADLYCCPIGSDSRTIVLSSLLRSGFVGLFTKFNCDFIIVKLDNASECQVWSEHYSDTVPFNDLRRNLPTPNILPHSVPQGNYAVNIDDINWAEYDIVISLNISIPQRVTKKFPNTVWAYCIGEPDMKTYLGSSQQLVEGYDLFLNQRFRRRPNKNKFHEIDFPYYLQYFGCFNDLLEIGISNSINKSGTIIEKHSFALMKKDEIKRFEAYGPIYLQEGNTEQMLITLLKAKYYFRLGGPKRWGNAMIEAGAGGCIFFGNKWEFVNRALFSNFTHIRSVDEFLRKVDILENNEDKYLNELTYLTNSVNELCFRRPLSELFKKSELIRKKKSQKEKLRNISS